MTVPNEVNPIWRARFVLHFPPWVASAYAGGYGGTGGPRCSHFWPGVRSAGPWLEGSVPDWPSWGQPSGPARSTDG